MFFAEKQGESALDENNQGNVKYDHKKVLNSQEKSDSCIYKQKGAC